MKERNWKKEERVKGMKEDKEEREEKGNVSKKES